MRERLHVGRVIAGAILLLLAYGMTNAGFQVLRDWASVQPALAVIGLLWFLSGVAMLISAPWLILPFRHHRFALALGGGGGLLSGGLLVVGVLTHIVPCSGPA